MNETNLIQGDRESLVRRIGFLEGAIEGIALYAIWKNGEQVVGCQQKPLKEVLQPYREELTCLQAKALGIT